MHQLELDSRSFHAFERSGDHLLFDRATGATLLLDAGSHTVFEALEKGESFESAIAIAERRVGGPDATTMLEAIEVLRGHGFFRYVAVDKAQQAEMLETLWQHKPNRIQLLMAQGCNLGCRYCYAWRNGSNQKGTLMSFDTAKASVDYLVKRSGERPNLQVTFFGGEPLLNYSVIREVVKYCRGLEQATGKTFLFELITNGTLLTEEITDWIVAEKFLLFVSLDGWKEMHNHNRPSMSGEDHYETIVRNAVYANEQYVRHGLVPPKIRANLTNRFNDSKSVGEYLTSLGFTIVGVAPIEPLPHGDPSPSALSEDQMDALHRRTIEMFSESIEHISRDERLTYFERFQLHKFLKQLKPVHVKGIGCGIARNTQTADNKGNIVPCHRYEGMEAYVLGNVFEGLDYEKTMAYYRKVNNNATERCHSCWIRDYCAGGCAWLLSAKDGHLADPTERECNRRRAGVEAALWARQRMRKLRPQWFDDKGELDLDSWNWTESGNLDPDSDLGDSVVEGKTSSPCGNCGSGGCSN